MAKESMGARERFGSVVNDWPWWCPRQVQVQVLAVAANPVPTHGDYQ